MEKELAVTAGGYVPGTQEKSVNRSPVPGNGRIPETHGHDD